MQKIIKTLLFSISMVTLTGCDNGIANIFPGYSHGDFIYLSYSDNARIDNVLVNKGDVVKAGQTLVKMEMFTTENALQRAEKKFQAESALLRNLETGGRPEELNVIHSQLERAKFSADQAKRQLERYQKLHDARNISSVEWETIRNDFAQKNAQVKELTHQLKVKQLPARQAEINNQISHVEEARLVLDKAHWDVQQSVITSPLDAKVHDVIYLPGERPSAGRPIISLLPPDNIKVRFFVPEKVLGKFHTGTKVKLSCDGCTASVPGTINYISPEAEYTPPIIYSTRRREKLIFMVEAVPAKEHAALLKIGQPFDVEIITNE